MMVLEPIELDIADVSDKHIGHSGWKEGGKLIFILPSFQITSLINQN